MSRKSEMTEEVTVSVVRRRSRVLAGLGTVDYVILGPFWSGIHIT